jgi:hypothetical protein
MNSKPCHDTPKANPRKKLVLVQSDLMLFYGVLMVFTALALAAIALRLLLPLLPHCYHVYTAARRAIA